MQVLSVQKIDSLSSSAGIGSSYPRFWRHRSCSSAFAGKVNGAANPNGSYMELTKDRIPHLVGACLSCLS